MTGAATTGQRTRALASFLASRRNDVVGGAKECLLVWSLDHESDVRDLLPGSVASAKQAACDAGRRDES